MSAMSRAVVWLCFLVASAITALDAQARSELTFSTGLHVPLGSIYDDTNLGPEFGFGFGVALTPSISIGVAYEWQRNGLSDELKLQRLGSTDAEGYIEIQEAAVYFKALLRQAAVKPYIKMQAGAAHFEVLLGDEASSAVNSHLSLGGGFGVQFGGSGRLGGYSEVLLHRVFVDENKVERNPLRDTEDELRTFASVRAGLIVFVDWI